MSQTKVPHLISCWRNGRNVSIILFEHRGLDQELEVKDGAVLVNQVRFIPAICKI